MKSIDRIVARSKATHSTDVHKRKAVVAIPSARMFNEDVKMDLWYVPGGGKSEYLLHLCDALISVRLCFPDYGSPRRRGSKDRHALDKKIR